MFASKLDFSNTSYRQFLIFKSVILWMILTFSSPLLLPAQRLLGEVSVPGKVGTIQALPFGDSILLSFHEKTEGNFLRNDYWISQGKARQTTLSKTGNQPLLALTR